MISWLQTQIDEKVYNQNRGKFELEPRSDPQKQPLGEPSEFNTLELYYSTYNNLEGIEIRPSPVDDFNSAQTILPKITFGTPLVELKEVVHTRQITARQTHRHMPGTFRSFANGVRICTAGTCTLTRVFWRAVFTSSSVRFHHSCLAYWLEDHLVEWRPATC